MVEKFLGLLFISSLLSVISYIYLFYSSIKRAIDFALKSNDKVEKDIINKALMTHIGIGTTIPLIIYTIFFKFGLVFKIELSALDYIHVLILSIAYIILVPPIINGALVFIVCKIYNISTKIFIDLKAFLENKK